MFINGYMIKDREEELKHKIGKCSSYIFSTNKYFASESTANPGKVYESFEEFEKLHRCLVKLSYLQTLYNVTIKDSNGVTLHELIKLQATDKAVADKWSSLEANTKNSLIYTNSDWKRKNDENEYAQFSVSADTSALEAEKYTSSIRLRRGQIRTLNAKMFETPDDGTDWEEVFSI